MSEAAGNNVVSFELMWILTLNPQLNCVGHAAKKVASREYLVVICRFAGTYDNRAGPTSREENTGAEVVTP